jgi:transposase
LRPRREREAFLRTTPLIGEQSQIDWAFVQNVAVAGGKRPLWMFVVVLSWSRAMWCELCFTLDASTVSRSLVRAAQAFDGVTRQWLFDVTVQGVGSGHRSFARSGDQRDVI